MGRTRTSLPSLKVMFMCFMSRTDSTLRIHRVPRIRSYPVTSRTRAGTVKVTVSSSTGRALIDPRGWTCLPSTGMRVWVLGASILRPVFLRKAELTMFSLAPVSRIMLAFWSLTRPLTYREGSVGSGARLCSSLALYAGTSSAYMVLVGLTCSPHLCTTLHMGHIVSALVCLPSGWLVPHLLQKRSLFPLFFSGQSVATCPSFLQ